MSPPVVAFVAWSGTGKTTLVERLVALATGQGLRVGAIKHTHHRFDVDHRGKDSHRLAAAGAEATLIAADDKLALVRRHAACPPADRLVVDHLGDLDLDLVLVEGWKGSELPRIEVHRSELGRPLICRGDGPPDPHLLAVASNAPLTVDVPVLDLDNPPAVLAFIRERFDLSRTDRRVNRPERLEQARVAAALRGRSENSLDQSH